MRADLVFSVAIYFLYLLGVLLFQSETILFFVRHFRLRHRLALSEEKSSLTKRCGALLSAVLGKDVDGLWLIVSVAMVFFVVFILCIRVFIIPVAFVMALVAASLPVLLLVSRLERIQSRGSREGMSMVNELYREYRIHELNITEAMEKIVSSDGNYPVCKKQLYLLLLRLRESRGRAAVEDACSAFSFALGTVWGKMLSSCIRTAVLDGTDISGALADICVQLKTAKLLFEERRRMNGESTRMALILVPLIYLGSLLLSHGYLGLDYSSLMRNQFGTREGLLLFLASVFLFAINLLLLDLVSSSKVDY